jgi:hypothetical protein
MLAIDRRGSNTISDSIREQTVVGLIYVIRLSSFSSLALTQPIIRYRPTRVCVSAENSTL